MNIREHGHDHGGIKRQKQGISSFSMQDSKLVFEELALCEGGVFLDLGCGAGDYSMVAAKIVGDSGRCCTGKTHFRIVCAVTGKLQESALSTCL